MIAFLYQASYVVKIYINRIQRSIDDLPHRQDIQFNSILITQFNVNTVKHSSHLIRI